MNSSPFLISNKGGGVGKVFYHFYLSPPATGDGCRQRLVRFVLLNPPVNNQMSKATAWRLKIYFFGEWLNEVFRIERGSKCNNVLSLTWPWSYKFIACKLLCSCLLQFVAALRLGLFLGGYLTILLLLLLLKDFPRKLLLKKNWFYFTNFPIQIYLKKFDDIPIGKIVQLNERINKSICECN